VSTAAAQVAASKARRKARAEATAEAWLTLVWLPHAEPGERISTADLWARCEEETWEAWVSYQSDLGRIERERLAYQSTRRRVYNQRLQAEMDFPRQPGRPRWYEAGARPEYPYPKKPAVLIAPRPTYRDSLAFLTMTEADAWPDEPAPPTRNQFFAVADRILGARRRDRNGQFYLVPEVA